jgi:hypothetical protein
MVGRWLRADPRLPPLGVTVTGPKSLRTVQVTAVASPMGAATVWIAGSTVTPWAAAVRRYGLSRNGEVRRDSTMSSQTPGIGLLYAREFASHDEPGKFV